MANKSEYFPIGHKLAHTATGSIKPSTGTNADHGFTTVMCFFFAKAYKSFQAIETLWNSGFAEDAFAITRTLFELYAQADLMRSDPKNNWPRYRDHEHYVMYKQYLKWVDNNMAEFVKRFEARADFAELKKNFDANHGRYRSWGWWDGGTLEQLTNRLQNQVAQQYYGSYWLQSALTHSTVTAIRFYVKLTADESIIRIDPYTDDVPKPLLITPALACLWMLGLVDQLNAALDLSLEDPIKEAHTAYASIGIGK